MDYSERLENYFIANDIVNPAKATSDFVNGVGASTYRLIKTLSLPGKPKDLSFAEIVERVRTHFNPKPSVIIKHYEFNRCVQRPGESVADYVAALRKITEHCDVLNDMLKDRLVCGTTDKHVQRWCLQETTMSYAEARDMALASETADRDSKRLQEPSGESQVGRLHRPSKRSQRSSKCLKNPFRNQVEPTEVFAPAIVTFVGESIHHPRANSGAMSVTPVTEKDILQESVTTET